MGGWRPADQQYEHEFSTGRTATLRAHLPMTALIADDQLPPDIGDWIIRLITGRVEADAESARYVRAIVRAAFVSPVVCADGEEPEVNDEGEYATVPFAALLEPEVMETIEQVAGRMAEIARFRGDTDGSEVSSGGGDVPPQAKRRGRVASGDGGGGAVRRPRRAGVEGGAGDAAVRAA
ncbi:MAG: hypothetical protein ACKVWR_21880 [Acidimicrobiales bacterium]